MGLFGNSHGAGLVEYMVVAGAISLVAIGAFQRYGSVIHSGLQAEAKRVKGEGSPGAADLLNQIGGLQDACEVAGVCPIGKNKCFAAGTPVATESGDRPIESIQVGDRVWARDVGTGAVDLREVVQRFVTPRQPVIELNLRSSLFGSAPEHLLVTPGHRFWVEGRGWTHAEDLAAAPLFSFSDLVSADVTTAATEVTTVYNIEVQGDHSYFVGHAHALVHNADNNGGDCNSNSQEDFNKLKDALKKALDTAIEDRLQNLPPSQRDAARRNIKSAIDNINNTLPESERDRAIAMAIAAGTDPKIKGFPDWQQHANGRTATDLRNEINELAVANAKSASTGPGATITIGQDQVTQGKSFDMQVNDGGQLTNVEVYSPTGQLDLGALGTGVNHAAEKVTPSTNGKVEAAIVVNDWPPPPKSVGGGATIETQPNGDQVLVKPDGTRQPMKSVLDNFLDNLNGSGKGAAPSGTGKVDSVVVYDGNGNPISTFTKDPSGTSWTKSP